MNVVFLALQCCVEQECSCINNQGSFHSPSNMTKKRNCASKKNTVKVVQIYMTVYFNTATNSKNKS